MVTDREWRFFPWLKIKDAVLFAQAGGIAVHDNPIGRRWARGGDAAHLFAPDEETLLASARLLRLKPEWIQRDRGIFGIPASRIHFDLKGAPLRAALRRCNHSSLESSDDTQGETHGSGDERRAS